MRSVNRLPRREAKIERRDVEGRGRRNEFNERVNGETAYGAGVINDKVCTAASPDGGDSTECYRRVRAANVHYKVADRYRALGMDEPTGR